MDRLRRLSRFSLAALVLLLLPLALTDCGPGAASDASQTYRPGAFDRSRSNMSISDLTTFSKFPIYWAGDHVGHYAFTSIWRMHRNLEEPKGWPPVFLDNITLFYGDCTVTGDDGGCWPPLEIQIWPHCQRPLAQAKAIGGRSVFVKKLGVPTVEVDDRTEIGTKDETVVLFGSSNLRAQAMNQLSAANSVARRITSDQNGNLPSPVAGELHPGKACR